jgi:hypothetical protein
VPDQVEQLRTSRPPCVRSTLCRPAGKGVWRRPDRGWRRGRSAAPVVGRAPRQTQVGVDYRRDLLGARHRAPPTRRRPC